MPGMMEWFSFIGLWRSAYGQLKGVGDFCVNTRWRRLVSYFFRPKVAREMRRQKFQEPFCVNVSVVVEEDSSRT